MILSRRFFAIACTFFGWDRQCGSFSVSGLTNDLIKWPSSYCHFLSENASLPHRTSYDFGSVPYNTINAYILIYMQMCI